MSTDPHNTGTVPERTVLVQCLPQCQELSGLIMEGSQASCLELLADLVKSNSWVGNSSREQLLHRILLRLCAR